MNKAVPWNVNGVGFDAREAAREAARRQGKSLGEWLHGVIADHAADIGIEANDMAGQQKIDAVTSRLERLSARSADHDRHVAQDGKPQAGRGGPTEPARRSRPHDDEDEIVEDALSRRDRGGRRHRRDDSAIEADSMLEQAIDSMERRADRAERRTDEALKSMAEMLRRNETHRDRERESVSVLAKKLSDIETRLTDKVASASDDNPIKGALARLEARLDTIGRRSAAEAVAREKAAEAAREQAATTPAGPAPEPLHRLEEKLNSILEAVHARPQQQPAAEISPFALAAFQAPQPKAQAPQPEVQAPQPEAQAPQPEAQAPQPEAQVLPRSKGRLGEAVADIARRQQLLDDGAPSVSLRDAILRRRDGGAVPRPTERPQAPAPFAMMQSEISALASKVEDLRRDVAQTKPQPSTVDLDSMRSEIAAMSESLRELAPRGRVSNLERSMRALVERVETSRDLGLRDKTLRPVANVVGDLGRALGSLDPHERIGGMRQDLHTIGDRIDDLTSVEPDAVARIQDQMQEIRDLITATAAKPLAAERIEHQIANLSERIDRQVRHPDGGQDLGPAMDDLRRLIANPPGAAAFSMIESRLETLATKIDAAVDKGMRRDAAETRQPAPAALTALETLVRDLSRKMEAVQAPGASQEAFDALQQQIGELSARFERSDEGLSKLASLERAMRDLFVHLEDTRASVETSAARAAREVLRIAVEEGRANSEKGTATSLATMQALQEEAEARTSSTLSAVHETLEKVVDRLSSMESDIADVRSRPLSAPSAAKSAATAPAMTAKATSSAKPRTISLGTPDPLMDQMLGHRLPQASERKVAPQRAAPFDLDDEQRRASFIAAARRAAKAAQTDPSVMDLTRPAPKPEKADSATRSALIEQSRNYVARHKKPVLLSIAALFVLVGTMAIVQRIGLGGNDVRIADAAAPAPITRAVDPTPQARPYRQSAELTPSALPKAAPPLAAQIPGSDPIQTGSISSLPSFAARSAPARATLPAGLQTMASAGDSGAEYVLATQYAEGRVVPRDFKLAASLYQKAAEKGVVPAQYRLASLYEKGLGVVQDKVKARSLYLRAAEAGNPRAMHNLAVLLADGDGKPDYDGAATWFRKAAQYGIHDSQYNLAILLARGLGTQQSFVQSYQWFAIAATHNDVDAAKKRDEVGSRLSANDLAVAKALAASFRPRIADVTATEVQPPPGGWDGASTSSPLNSPRPKISML